MRNQAVRWKIARRHINPPRRPRRLRWVLLAAFLLLLLTTGAGAAAGMYFASQLPPASGFRVHYTFQDARIFDARGDLLYNMADLRKKGGQRVVEPLQNLRDYSNPCRGGVNRIPLVLQNATIATEDATFYKNPGFDPMSIVRAAYQDVTYGHIVSGASTITQQLVRANMLTDERSLSRKAQEVALAYEIAKRFSKRKILWYYLNSVPYGNLAIGAAAAARVYFNQPVCSLGLAQAALLAGLPRAPTLYDPVKHRAVALVRMREVLGLMRKHGYLRSGAPVAQALQTASRWTFHPPQATMRYPHFVRFVVSQLQAKPALRTQLYQGIDVYTTLDPRLQDLAQGLVTRQINDLTAVKHVTDGALVSLDLRPQHYGWILAMVGSAHSSGQASQINMAITPRQPGSSMKPFNYIWAFTHGGVGPGTLVQDEPIRLPDPNDVQDGGWYEPKNYDHLFHGPVTLRQALANSLNVPAVKVEYYITGVKNVAQTASQFGMTSLYGDNPGLDCSVCYAMTLGGLSKGTRLLEETSAYAVFATSGWTVPPVAIWKVVRRSTGQVLYCSEACPEGVRPDPDLARARRQVLDASHAYEMTNVLSDNNARCTVQVCEFGLTSPLLLSRPSAAKTGTTTDWTDNWTVGYTPQLVTGVWVGNADRSPMIDVIGITGAAPIWHDFMENAFSILRLPTVAFRQPPDVVPSAQCTFRNARGYSLGVMDLHVGPASSLPLCALPERGYTPVPCSQYPVSPQYPLPSGCGPGASSYVCSNGRCWYTNGSPYTGTNPYGTQYGPYTGTQYGPYTGLQAPPYSPYTSPPVTGQYPVNPQPAVPQPLAPQPP